MKLINADYLTGRIFTEADLANAHTCYESIMAIIESMESDDALDKLRAEIEAEPYISKMEVLDIIDKYKTESEG